MSDQPTRNGEGSTAQIAQALQDVSTHAQNLVREEIELAKTEVTTKAKKLGRGAAIGAAAGIFVLAALVLILHGIAWLLWFWLFPSEQIFWGFFMEAGILLLLAAIAGLLAARAFKAGSPPTPQMAIDEAQRIKATVQNPEQEARR
jgi:uncharacterized membrane protein YqjE